MDYGSNPGAARYPHVFSPVAVGRLQLRNRILVPAHTTNYGDDNLPSERHLAYHRARAAGGAALIIFETIRVHTSTLGRQQGVNGFDRRCIEPFARIVRAVHGEGARMFGQVVHMGRQVDGNYSRAAPWGASPVPWASTAPVPHEMTAADIEEVVAAHAQAAANLVEAGMDGVEVHLGHGHLLQQFMSPASNRRQDGYGGTDANRLRLALEVLRAVRERVGKDFPVGIRISADEYLPGGLGIEDMERLVPQVLRAVPVQFVNVSHSAYHGSTSLNTQMADMAFSVESFRALPRRIAAAIAPMGDTPPVFAVCKVRSIAEAEEILADGVVSMVAMARAHMADPAIVGKALIGREDQTTPCIACNQGCAGMLQQNLAITCLTNPAMGREASWGPLAPVAAAARRKVLVVGAGPAGLEAAAVAAQLGHDVQVWERSSATGGSLAFTRRMPKRSDFGMLLDHQLRQCRAAGVVIEMGREATRGAIAASGADVVVLATGATPRGLAFEGGGTGLTLEEALRLEDVVGSRIAVVDTLGTWAVAATVEYLADRGAEVTLVVPAGAPAWHVTIYSGYAWRDRIRARRVRIMALHTIHSWRDGEAVLQDLSTGGLLPPVRFDHVVAATHGVTNRSLLGELAAAGGSGPQVLLIGDARSPRSALEAVFEGHEAARSLAAQ
jgi:2,4-dienoyl-CoA reductase-like NADH-dependent reductase (Old Yellow Enzyme family)/NADPH-dependent 2,4-dienoyl-CoA reductase/sulfur reductase-like enzyme